MSTTEIEYNVGDLRLRGHLALPAEGSGPFPCVLVAHAFLGLHDFERGRADALAELGYAAFALDLYGESAEDMAAGAALMNVLKDDRELLRQRVMAAYEVVTAHESVDADRVAIIGYCFGGMTALDLARAGASLRGVVSFHGNLTGHELPGQDIDTRVLALHGHEDPICPPEMVDAFIAEMKAKKVDWQLHSYGGTLHSFTNPGVDLPDMGAAYHAVSERRSWRSMQNFLAEVFE